MITIYKYLISSGDPFISMPKGAEILSVGFQSYEFYLWAKVDTEQLPEDREIRAYGTGHEIVVDEGKELKFLGTGHTKDGLVFHAFEHVAT